MKSDKLIRIAGTITNLTGERIETQPLIAKWSQRINRRRALGRKIRLGWSSQPVCQRLDTR